MNFKSKNWNFIQENKLKCRVAYLHAKLDLPISGKRGGIVPTTVVILWNDDCRYVGVAQCSDKDEYNKLKGREVAAGRALKNMLRHVENPEANPNDVWSREDNDEQVLIYGDIPESVEHHINDQLVFGSEQ